MSNLSSTLWKEPYSIVPLQVHSDVRGDLFEVLRFKSQSIPPSGQIYVYTIEPSHTRGMHFHTRKHEWIVCVAGTCHLTIIPTDEPKDISFSLHSATPQLVYVAPHTVHSLFNPTTQVCTVLAYTSSEFDPSDPDTFPFSH